MVHVSLYNFQSVLFNEGSDQADPLEVGSNLRLHVAQVVGQRSRAADPWDVLLQIGRGHKQLGDSLLLQGEPSVSSATLYCMIVYSIVVHCVTGSIQVQANLDQRQGLPATADVSSDHPLFQNEEEFWQAKTEDAADTQGRHIAMTCCRLASVMGKQQYRHLWLLTDAAFFW